MLAVPRIIGATMARNIAGGMKSIGSPSGIQPPATRPRAEQITQAVDIGRATPK